MLTRDRLLHIIEQLDVNRHNGSTVCKLCKRMTGQAHKRGCDVGKAKRELEALRKCARGEG